MKKLLTFLIFMGITAFGQTTFNWRDEPTTLTGSWNVTAHWWNGSTTELPSGNDILRFNNNKEISMTNNLASTNRYQIWFDGGATIARTIAGGTTNTFSGASPKIENSSTATHTIGFAIELGNQIELNPVSGNLTFTGTINTNANSINVWSGSWKVLKLEGVVSGSGGITVKNSAVLDIAAAHTYSGATIMEYGTLRISGSGSLANSAVTLASGTIFNLNDVSTTVKSVSQVGNLNSGTITLGSGTLTINGGWGDGTTFFQNSISGTGSVIKNGTGKLELFGTQSFTGSLGVNGGILATQVSLSSSTVNLNSGGTFEIINNANINELDFNGGTLSLNGKILTMSKLTLQNGTSFSLPSSVIIAPSVEVKSGATFNVTDNMSLTTLTLNSGSTLNITSGKTLTVTNLVYNDGTNTYPLPTGLTATNITVKNSSTFNINSNFSFGSLTIEAGGSVSVSSASLTMSGNLSNSGTLNLGSNKVTFTGGNTVSGTVAFTDVDISGGVNFGTGSTINGTLQINAGGFVTTNAPAYATNSILKYNSATVYGRATEWSSTSGSGYPFNVLLTNNTTLDLGANGGVSISRQMAGSLTIDAGSTLELSGSNKMVASLIILKDITNAGTLNLSESIGGDLNVGGNFANNGTFNCNNREVAFHGTSNQSISGSQAITFDYFAMNNPNGITLNRAITIDDRLRMETGKLTLGAHTLTLNSGAAVSGAALSSTNMVVANSTGKLRKMYTDGTGAVAAFTFPLGDVSKYSPVTITINSGTRSSAYVEANLRAEAHPSKNVEAGALFLNRYWTVSPSGITTPNYNISITYDETDVSVPASEASLVLGKWDGLVWARPASSVNTGTNTITSNNLTSFSDFTGGEADALPVELTSFNAAIRNGIVDLKWETATEVNNNGFDVERKTSTADWSKIGFVEGHGMSNSPKYYSFSDKPVGTGKIAYRLKQIDNDGQFEYSPVVEVLVDNLPNGFVMEQNFPNPFNPETSIRFALKEDTKATLQVFNTMGELVTTLFDGIAEAGRYYDIKFSGNDLSSGFYIYKLVAGDHVAVKKMLLMK